MNRRQVRNLPRMIGRHDSMLELYELARLAAPTDHPTVIIGETGTGKELVARALHELSPRASQPFIAVNCAAIPETLAEAELFGTERGAYTGAVALRRGRVELADGGILFLDEVCSASLNVQAKLLRAIEFGEFWRVGGTKGLSSSFRLVAAVSEQLDTLIAARRLREDLAYRLAVVELHAPPLRQRRSDIPALAEHFARQGDVSGVHFTADAIDALRAAPWPGNVRQLRSVVERIGLLAGGGRADAVLVRRVLKRAALSREGVESALAQSDGSVRGAAKLLGVPRTSLRTFLSSNVCMTDC